MKLKHTIAGMLLMAGLFILIGSAGAVDNDIITVGRFVGQSLIGLAMIGVSAWMERDVI